MAEGGPGHVDRGEADVDVVELLENQTFHQDKTWVPTSGKLPSFTLPSGQPCLSRDALCPPSHEWLSAWQLDMISTPCDPNGWMYALDFSAPTAAWRPGTGGSAG